MQVRKQQLERHGTTDRFQIGKGVRLGCILSPCLFNLYAEYIMRNAGLEEAHAGIKIARRKLYSHMQINGIGSLSYTLQKNRPKMD